MWGSGRGVASASTASPNPALEIAVPFLFITSEHLDRRTYRDRTVFVLDNLMRRQIGRAASIRRGRFGAPPGAGIEPVVAWDRPLIDEPTVSGEGTLDSPADHARTPFDRKPWNPQPPFSGTQKIDGVSVGRSLSPFQSQIAPFSLGTPGLIG